jgi:hypothetical protein
MEYERCVILSLLHQLLELAGSGFVDLADIGKHGQSAKFAEADDRVTVPIAGRPDLPDRFLRGRGIPLAQANRPAS